MEEYFRAKGVPAVVDSVMGRLLDEKPDDAVQFLIAELEKIPEVMVFQLGTNNWQSKEEFAPGSGILHQAHHEAYNAMPKTKCYSIFPSRRQKSDRPDVKVFELSHDIPICESISPVSSYRWHSMSEEDFDAYRTRLANEVYDFMEMAEEKEGRLFTHAIAHHTFLNPLVMRDVNRRRIGQGKPKLPIIVFAHGTALKMYVHEKSQEDPKSFPARFLPLMNNEKVWEDQEEGVALAFAISQAQIDMLLDIFPRFPKTNVCISPNGINPLVFYPKAEFTIANILPQFQTKPYEGSVETSKPLPGSGIDHVVLFVGKMADWKRLDCVLQAATIYEKALGYKVATLVVGGGPVEDVKKYQDYSRSLDLRHCYFLGPHGQPELHKLYNAANVGIFPSFEEPFGLVFLECMACGTPVIGANSGGPKDFVSDSVGTLVPEAGMDAKQAMAQGCADAVLQAIREDWKTTKSAACLALATGKYSVANQCTAMLNDCKRILGQ